MWQIILLVIAFVLLLKYLLDPPKKKEPQQSARQTDKKTDLETGTIPVKEPGKKVVKYEEMIPKLKELSDKIPLGGNFFERLSVICLNVVIS